MPKFVNKYFPFEHYYYEHQGKKVVDRMNRVPDGSPGTLYQFRTRDGLPTCGLAHPRMWGVAFDDYPAGLSGHNGIFRFEDYRIADEQQPPEVTALLDLWLAALAEQTELEQEMARLHRALPEGKYSIGRPDLHALLRTKEGVAEERRRAYDAAAGIYERVY